jgi:hypothetical protein
MSPRSSVAASFFLRSSTTLRRSSSEGFSLSPSVEVISHLPVRGRAHCSLRVISSAPSQSRWWINWLDSERLGLQEVALRLGVDLWPGAVDWSAMSGKGCDKPSNSFGHALSDNDEAANAFAAYLRLEDGRDSRCLNAGSRSITPHWPRGD